MTYPRAATSKGRRDLILYDVHRGGHRGDYFRVLRRLVGGYVVTGRPLARLRLLLGARQVVCSTYDDYFMLFFWLSLARSCLGRITVGIAVRSETVFHRGGFRLKIKSLLLKLLKQLPLTHTLTVMPYWVEPRLASVSSDWIYELQYWDLDWLDVAAVESVARFQRTIEVAARGRKVIGAIGHQRRVKGAEYFMQLYGRADMSSQYLFVCIGPRWDVDPAAIETFRSAGGVFIDTQLRDDEVVPIYTLFDVIWACYRPDYDQSSGIFGRALQLGLPTIVRAGSYLARLQEGLSNKGYQIPYADTDCAARILLADPSESKARFEIGPERSFERLRGILGLAPIHAGMEARR